MATRGCRSSRSRHGPVARPRRSPQKRARNSSIQASSHAAQERLVTRIWQCRTSSLWIRERPARGRSCSTPAGESSAPRRRSSRSTFRSRAGSSTTPRRSGRRSSAPRPEAPCRRPGCAPATSRRSASPTSARPSSSGTARTGRPASPRDRLAGPPHGARYASGCAPTGRERRHAPRRPAWCSTRTSRARSSRWLLDHVPGARKKAEAGELAVRHDRLLARLEPDAAGGATSPT